jgi:F0F1-type ATP synthase delta subunit
MATKLSRRKLAGNVAARLSSGESKKAVFQELAAYLIDSNRKKEATLIVRDIEAMLFNTGTAIGTVTSARPLSEMALQTIESFVKQQNDTITDVVLREHVDETLIGGVRLELPGHQLDASVKAKLEQLTV